MENEEQPLNLGIKQTPTAEELIQFDKPKKEKLSERISNWVKNPSNRVIIFVFITIIILRFYYFWITKNQPVWWDESEYLSAAKSFAGIVDYQLADIRLPGLPILISIFYMIGITQEPIIRFFISFIPSILVLFVIYFLIIEMYSDKRIAIISTILFGVLWESLFYSNRFQTEHLSLLFELFAFLILFKVYMKKEKLSFITPKLSLLWILLFSILSILIRSGSAPFFPTIILFIILLHQSFFTDKKNKVVSITALILSIILILYVYLNLEKIPIINIAYHPDFELGWASLTVFRGFFDSVIPNIPPVLLYTFYIGFFLTLFNTFFLIDKIKNIKKDSSILEFKSDLFNLILLISVLFAFVYLIRPSAIEFRWFFLILLPIFIFTSKGIIFIADLVGKLSKTKMLIILIILLISGIGIYNQVIHADSIIHQRLNSYSQIKDAGLWIKENSELGDYILTRSPHQITYYSERPTSNYGQFNESQFFELVNQTHPKYMVESALEPHPGEWGLEPTIEMQKILTPVQVFYAEDGKTPIAIIYQFN